tara:strand:- start:318 stop:548 length:231 start_codon:yes stop_codon:yes gene_type:complete
LKRTDIKSFLHAFFIIKKEDYYINNMQIIDDFRESPGLYRIAKNRNIDIKQVYNIVKTHDINILNMNIIKLIEKIK